MVEIRSRWGVLAAFAVLFAAVAAFALPGQAYAVTSYMTVGDTITYTCTWDENWYDYDITGQYTSLYFVDELPPGLYPTGYTVKRGGTTLSSSHGYWTQERMADHTADRNHYRLKYTATNISNKSYWPMAHNTYTFTITCKIAGNCDANIKNVFKAVPDGDERVSNTVTKSTYQTPAFTMTKTPSKTSAYIGEEVTYSIRVAFNSSTNMAVRNWVIKDTLPEHLTFDPDTFSYSMATAHSKTISTEVINSTVRGVGWTISGSLWGSEEGALTVSYKGTAYKAGTYTNTVSLVYTDKLIDGVPHTKDPPLKTTATVTYNGFPIVYNVDLGTDHEMVWEDFADDIYSPYTAYDPNTYVWHKEWLEGGVTRYQDIPVKKDNAYFVTQWYKNDTGGPNGVLTNRYNNDAYPSASKLYLYCRNKYYLNLKTLSVASILRSDIKDHVYRNVNKDSVTGMYTIDTSSKLSIPSETWRLYGVNSRSTNADHLLYTFGGQSFPWQEEGLERANPVIYNYGSRVVLPAPRYTRLYAMFDGRVRTIVPVPTSANHNIYYKRDGTPIASEMTTEVVMNQNWDLYKDWAISTFDGVLDREQDK